MTTDPCPARRRIVLGPAAHVLRRRVGATAWMVLEEMLQRSNTDADGCMAAVSVRSLASSLGVANDTAHRAIKRLRDLGVIEPHQARTTSGSFSTGGYRLKIPAACLSIVDTSPSPSAPVPATPCGRAAAPPPASDQLSLLLKT